MKQLTGHHADDCRPSSLQPEKRLNKTTHRETAFYGVFFQPLGKEGDLLQCIARIQEGTTTKHLQGVFPFLLSLFFFRDDGNEGVEKMHYGKKALLVQWKKERTFMERSLCFILYF